MHVRLDSRHDSSSMLLWLLISLSASSTRSPILDYPSKKVVMVVSKKRGIRCKFRFLRSYDRFWKEIIDILMENSLRRNLSRSDFSF